MDGLPLLLSCMGDTAQERVAKMGGWREPGYSHSDPPSHLPPNLGWDPDSYLWRLAGRGGLWAWGPPGLRAPPFPV